jgi:hypothetical protein
MEQRDSLKAAGSGAAALTAVSFKQIHGANDRLRVGLIDGATPNRSGPLKESGDCGGFRA